MIFEADEESGGTDIEYYITKLKSKIGFNKIKLFLGDVKNIFCLDSFAGND
jgi:acetylornithine deacetylase/succinyl-diaminopimelate desuccinylase-like protein